MPDELRMGFLPLAAECLLLALSIPLQNSSNLAWHDTVLCVAGGRSAKALLDIVDPESEDAASTRQSRIASKSPELRDLSGQDGEP